mgnify:CR=1 FL=1
MGPPIKKQNLFIISLVKLFSIGALTELLKEEIYEKMYLCARHECFSN